LSHSTARNVQGASIGSGKTKSATEVRGLELHARPAAGRARDRVGERGLSGRNLLITVAAIWATVACATAQGSAALSPARVASPVRSAPKPPIVLKLVPFGAKRRAETAAYAKRHYGTKTWRLERPRVIVQHHTASSSFSSAYSTFAADTPDAELGELPGVCAHFLIDRDGRIYRLVRLDTMCRHTVGLNWTAFGIEHVGTSDRQILGNRAQLSASLSLTLWLMSSYDIQLRNVIGHNESLTSPYHRENYRAWRCQTHGDWRRANMAIYRAALARLARRYRVPLGPQARPVTPRCG
jgi:N-acetylmuramoyl-L-alanine amidase